MQLSCFLKSANCCVVSAHPRILRVVLRFLLNEAQVSVSGALLTLGDFYGVFLFFESGR